MFSNEIKNNVIRMRELGKSLEEISSITKISKSTLSVWLRHVILNDRARLRLRSLQVQGNKKASATLSRKKSLRKLNARLRAKDTLKKIPVMTEEQGRLLCALMYYCEGAKSDQRMAFTNSDPDLMKTFMALLRNSFNLDESRFRACIHLHSYHDEKTQKAFWSKVMNVPVDYFIKSFKKKEGGIFKKKDYPGCATIRYHDAALARELLETARQYFKMVS